MQSTLTPQDTDPHDAFVIEPDVVLATRQASPDPVQELLSHLAQKAAERSSEVSAAAPRPAVETPAVGTPRVDTTFRATAVNSIDATDRPVVPDDRRGIGWWLKRAFVAFVFALCSAFAAAAWTHHGAVARQMISSWMPPYVLAALPVMDRPVTDKPAAAEQPDSAAQAADGNQTSVAPAQPPEAAAPVVTAAAPSTATSPTEPAPSAQSPSAASPTQSSPTQPVAHDLATIGQQIEQLKASIEQLKTSQAQMSRDIAKNAEAKNLEAKNLEARNSENRNSEPIPRPKASALPRPVAAIPPRPRKPPRQAYLPPPAAITSPQPGYTPSPAYVVSPAHPLPQPAMSQPLMSQPAASQPAPLPEAISPSDDGPVIRPPMPLR